jgi:chromate transporter
MPAMVSEESSLRGLLVYFLRLGTLGFGGPIALASRMNKDLVEQRRWLSRQDYLEGLAFSQLSPGPLAAQLAMYIGWLKSGPMGAALAGIALIAPSFCMAMALAIAYARFGRLPWIQNLFYGIGAAVIAIISLGAYRLSRRILARDWFLWALFAGIAIATVCTGSEIVWLFVVCGFAAMLVRHPPSALPVVAPIGGWWLAGLRGATSLSTLGTLSLFFVKAGAFSFGSGLAIVPFLYAGVVHDHRWLTERQFLDAIAVAMITPGPVVITAAFIGYLVAGLAGGTAAAIAVFLPPFLIVILAAPHYRRFAGNPRVRAFVQGVTAGAMGAIAGSVIILGSRSLVDWVTVGIACAVLLALVRFPRIPEPVLIFSAALIGLIRGAALGPL